MIEITQNEAARYDVLRRVPDGAISLVEAATIMGVSCSQAKQLAKKADEDLVALAHANRGRKPSNELAAKVRTRIVSLSHEDYPLFNDTHFTEQPPGKGIGVCREMVRRIRRDAGIAPERKRKGKKHQWRRTRKTSEGLTILCDVSLWFGSDRSACSLIEGIYQGTTAKCEKPPHRWLHPSARTLIVLPSLRCADSRAGEPFLCLDVKRQSSCMTALPFLPSEGRARLLR